MCAMRVCAATNLFVGAIGALIATIAACTGGSGPTSPPEASGVESPTPVAGESPPAAGGTPDEPAPGKPGEPQSAADCTQLVTEITNDPPDDGVPMNNAQTAGDAGKSDRLLPIIDVMKKHRDGFRCCFDLWGRDNPGQSSKVAFQVDLKPSGEVRSAGIKHDESDLHAKAVEECMVSVANSMAFPESPTGKDTKYTHRFNFKAR